MARDDDGDEARYRASVERVFGRGSAPQAAAAPPADDDEARYNASVRRVFGDTSGPALTIPTATGTPSWETTPPYGPHARAVDNLRRNPVEPGARIGTTEEVLAGRGKLATGIAGPESLLARGAEAFHEQMTGPETLTERATQWAFPALQEQAEEADAAMVESRGKGLGARAGAALGATALRVPGALAGLVGFIPNVAETIGKDVYRATDRARRGNEATSPDVTAIGRMVTDQTKLMSRKYTPGITADAAPTQDESVTGYLREVFAAPPPGPDEPSGLEAQFADLPGTAFDILGAFGTAAAKARAPVPGGTPRTTWSGRSTLPPTALPYDVRQFAIQRDVESPQFKVSIERAGKEARIERGRARAADRGPAPEQPMRQITPAVQPPEPAKVAASTMRFQSEYKQAKGARPPMSPAINAPPPARFADPAWAKLSETGRRAAVAKRSGPLFQLSVDPSARNPRGGIVGPPLKSSPFAKALKGVKPVAATVETARGVLEIQAGDTLKVGDQRFPISEETVFDPVTIRSIGEAVGGRPTRKAVESMRRPGAVAPAVVMPVKAAAPVARDLVTNKDYPVKFTGEAKETRVEVERARRAGLRKFKASERGSLNLAPILDPAAEVAKRAWAKAQRMSALLEQSARRLGVKSAPSVAKVADVYAKAARKWLPIRRPLEEIGKRIGLEAQWDKVSKGATAMPGRLGGAARLVRDMTVPATSKMSDRALQFHGEFAEYADASREHILARVKDLEGVPEEIKHDLTYALMNNWAYRKPDAALRKMMTDAGPIMARSRDAWTDLGLGLEDANLIRPITRESKESSFFPQMYQRVIDFQRDVLVDEGLLKPADTAQFGERTRGHVEFLVAGGETNVKRIMSEGYERAHRALDRAQFLNELANEPELTVSVDGLLRDQERYSTALSGLKTAQQPLGPNPKGAKPQPKTLNSAIEETNVRRSELNAEREALWKETREVEGRPMDGSQPNSNFNEIDSQIADTMDEWQALTQLKAELGGRDDVTVPEARKHIATRNKEIAAGLKARAQEAADKGFIPMAEVMRNSARPASDAGKKMWGAMRNGFVDPAIAPQLEEMIMPPDQFARQVEGGLSVWKSLHTVWNLPKSYKTNILGAMMLMRAHGIPYIGQTVYGVKALTRMASGIDPLITEYRKAGLRLPARIDPADVTVAIQKLTGETVAGEGGLVKAARVVRHNIVGRTYGLSDTAFRIGAAEYFQEVYGMTLQEAVRAANEAVPDPSNAPPAFRRLQRSKYGHLLLKPFMSIPAQTLGQAPRLLTRNPLGVVALAYSASILAQAEIATGLLTKEEWDEKKRQAPDSPWNLWGFLNKEWTPTMDAPTGVRSKSTGEMIYERQTYNPALGFGSGKETDMLFDLPLIPDFMTKLASGRDPESGRPIKDIVHFWTNFLVNAPAAYAVDVVMALPEWNRKYDRKTQQMMTPTDEALKALPKLILSGGGTSQDVTQGVAKARALSRIYNLYAKKRERPDFYTDEDIQRQKAAIIKDEGWDPAYIPQGARAPVQP